MATTEPFDFDIAVVGASFAGAACAIAAAQRGLRVCVLERKLDPGAKLRTTGIIVKEAAEQTLLNQLPAHLTRRIEQVRLFAPSLKQIALAAPGYYFLTTDTPGVMRWLADEIVRHGAQLRLGESFVDARREGDGWYLPNVGRVRYLVGADGARSRVAQRCGLGQVRQFLYGIEYEFPGACLADPGALHCFLSKRYAPGYIGWIAQSPTGVQAGLALRHDPERARVPDIDAFLLRVGEAGGLPRRLRPGHARAGLIPCSGPVDVLARDGAILTGDAAGIVSPVTAGGIHSAWEHGWSVGRAVSAHLREGGPDPGQVAVDVAPRFRTKRALRWAFDRLQFDWPFDLLLHSPPLRWAAGQVYFHKRREH
ncbi:NAD(P)/FAD-dependent oxidoreductase [Agrilutibacter solisilvae]|uniref:NAD(P)/FAD-dependent oxidoreductase n=1 Tax=Agrilutibacter solisilvae TaxID=2763317 RepID=A0A974XWZ0_9GAMM|nr:NAD(P)/FAD-dependent oxidoreductase [Lysobacter solisilvae]QSX77381.1 NAD(P)/FAD-dependent oxidoreductase [Lysobacter solisilvae]